MNKRKLFRAGLVATFVGAMITASPALAVRSFQLKNCNTSSNAWKWVVFNANDSVDIVPYMSFSFSETDQTKTGKCVGDNKGYCKIQNVAVGTELWHVEASATVYGGANSVRHYDGLLDCNSEPAH